MLQSAVSDDFDAVLAALDLVFRWLVLRMCEGNTQVGPCCFKSSTFATPEWHLSPAL